MSQGHFERVAAQRVQHRRGRGTERVVRLQHRAVAVGEDDARREARAGARAGHERGEAAQQGEHDGQWRSVGGAAVATATATEQVLKVSLGGQCRTRGGFTATNTEAHTCSKSTPLHGHGHGHGNAMAAQEHTALSQDISRGTASSLGRADEAPASTLRCLRVGTTTPRIAAGGDTATGTAGASTSAGIFASVVMNERIGGGRNGRAPSAVARAW
mgnify:CR=1 FL=1